MVNGGDTQALVYQYSTNDRPNAHKMAITSRYTPATTRCAKAPHRHISCDTLMQYVRTLLHVMENICTAILTHGSPQSQHLLAKLRYMMDECERFKDRIFKDTEARKAESRMQCTKKMVVRVREVQSRMDKSVKTLMNQLMHCSPEAYKLATAETDAARLLVGLSQQTDFKRFASAGPSLLPPTATLASAFSGASMSARNEGNSATTCVALEKDIPGTVASMCA